MSLPEALSSIITHNQQAILESGPITAVINTLCMAGVSLSDAELFADGLIDSDYLLQNYPNLEPEFLDKVDIMLSMEGHVKPRYREIQGLEI
jgi:hypothetical protein